VWVVVLCFVFLDEIDILGVRVIECQFIPLSDHSPLKLPDSPANNLPEHGLAARQARHNGSRRDIEHGGIFTIRKLVGTTQGEPRGTRSLGAEEKRFLVHCPQSCGFSAGPRAVKVHCGFTVDLWDVSLSDRAALVLLVSLCSREAVGIRCTAFQEEQLKQAVVPSLKTSANWRLDPDHWVDGHGDDLYRYTLTRVRKPEIAEDLVQETLLAALRAQKEFSGCSTERSWLTGILKNKICDHFRRLGRETNFSDLELFSDEHPDRFDGGQLWIHELGPKVWKHEGEAAMKRAEFWQALHGCIARLPERMARVFKMREIEEATLWVMLHRARMALRRTVRDPFLTGVPKWIFRTSQSKS
jgi:RNA polymerase sigma-70 factor (ECF subfamily)